MRPLVLLEHLGALGVLQAAFDSPFDPFVMASSAWGMALATAGLGAEHQPPEEPQEWERCPPR